jgi:hypothetical protein
MAMMVEAGSSPASVYLDETRRRYIPEGCNIITRRLENLKSHVPNRVLCDCKSNTAVMLAAVRNMADIMNMKFPLLEHKWD